MSRKNRIIIPIVIIIAGIAAAATMVFLKPKASRSRPNRQAALVEIMTAQKQSLPAKVKATGVVSAANEITLLPEVSGRIVSQSEKLVPGGRFEKGETMARIDSRNYSLAVRQAESQVKQAELEMQLEQGRQKTAKKEWEILGDERPESEAALALRKPHLEAAKEALVAAKSSLDQAKLNLSRTTLRAPFNCVVLEEGIDVGQVVGQSSVVATLAGVDRFWIASSLRVDQLGLIQIPGFNADTGSKATITQNLGNGQETVREGEVVKLAGKLDSQTRTAQVLVALDNPMEPPEGQLPILIGAYVDMEITGQDAADAFIIPRSTLVGGNSVWTVNDENRLTAVDVAVVWSDDNEAAVTGALKEGDRLVTTPPAIPVEGMPVRIQGEKTENELPDSGAEGGNES